MSSTLFISHPFSPNNTTHSTESFIPTSDSSIRFSFSLISDNSSLKIPKQTIHSANPSSYPNFTSKSPNPNPNFKKTSHDNARFNVPASKTAPWIKRPLLLEPNQVLDLSKNPSDSVSGKGKENPSLTRKVSGGRGKKAMKIIYQGIEKLEDNPRPEDTQRKPGTGFEYGLEFLGGDLEVSKPGRRMPWERDERMVFRRVKRERVVTAAELSLDGLLLERLRGEAAKMRKWVKVKKAGVTEAVVDQIRLIWKTDELAMLKFDLPLCRNMDRAREIVELKTRGIVVWSKKDMLVIYRGSNYRLGFKSVSEKRPGLGGDSNISYGDNNSTFHVKSNQYLAKQMVGRAFEVETMPVTGSLYEREADRLLDGLGPRYVDWWMPKPLPVDGDLLPEVVPGFKRPLRLCPWNARSKLTDDELTQLRKLAFPLPTHFVLGRNRNLQGLAAAILKLWEKCHIAKIAVKWGIPNTNNEEMATELKCLTGGVLLLRNKFYIILYRGKDFIPPGVVDLVAEREMEHKNFQIQEEAARANAVGNFYFTGDTSLKDSLVGTLSEFQAIQSEHLGLEKKITQMEVKTKAEIEKLGKEIRNQERKLFILKMKMERTSKDLAKLNTWHPAELDKDNEIITEEERECFRKMGLKLDSTLLLGRRGVFDGVIEGLHQHWKHRELVKVITMQRVFSKVILTAQHLEAESGGVLISIEKLKEGHGIIIYRGKNYKRPLNLFPNNLLSKRDALRRSLEMQRLGSLKFFAKMRQQAIYSLKCKLEKLQKDEN